MRKHNRPGHEAPKETLSLNSTLFALCLTALLALPCLATTVTGTIHRPDGTPLTGTIEFVLSQQAKTTTAPILFAPVRTTCAVTSGLIAAGCTVQGNDTLDPAGTYYTVRVLDANNRVVVPATNYTIAGPSVNLGALPVTATATLVPPTGNVVGNLNVTGNLTVAGSADIGSINNLATSHLLLQGLGADPPGITDGSIFHRSDLNRVRLRTRGLQLFDGTQFVDIATSQNSVDIGGNLRVAGATQLGASADLTCLTGPPGGPLTGTSRLFCLLADKRIYQKDDTGLVAGPLAALNSPQTWTAAQSFSLANNTRFADTFPGADAGGKIAACIADLPATGGTCDARGLEGAQTISSTISVGAASRPVKLLLSHGATFAPASASLDMFSLGPNGVIDGLRADATGLSYTGSVIKLTGSYTQDQQTAIRNVRLKGVTGASGTGNAILLQQSGGASGIAFVSVENADIEGFERGLFLDAQSDFINGNHFQNMVIAGAKRCVELKNIPGTTSVNGNLFANLTCQFNTGSEKSYVIGGEGNQFFNAAAWDYSGPTWEFSSNSSLNYVSGRVDGDLTDNGTSNVFLDTLHRRWNLGLDSGIQFTTTTDQGWLWKNRTTGGQWNITQGNTDLDFVRVGVGTPFKVQPGGITAASGTFSGAVSVTGDFNLRDRNILNFFDADSSNFIGFRDKPFRTSNLVLNWAMESNCSGFGNGGKLTVNASNEVVCAADESGATPSFTSLSDTPSSYTGHAGKFVRVNSVPDALEFVAQVATADIADNAVTDAKLRDSASLSVIGRSADTSGDPADIAAGTDHQVLRRSGTSLGFGAVNLAQSAAVTGVLPVGNWSPLTTNGDLLYHNGTTSTRLPRGTDGQCLTSTATTIAWGSCAAGGGITSLNGLTASTQTFSKVDDTNVTLAITSASANHEYALGWAGQLGASRGGTGPNTSGSTGVPRISSGTWSADASLNHLVSALTGATTITSDATAETVTYSFESAFTTGNQFLVRQQTGNPSGGTVFGIDVADPDVQGLSINGGAFPAFKMTRSGSVGFDLIDSTGRTYRIQNGGNIFELVDVGNATRFTMQSDGRFTVGGAIDSNTGFRISNAAGSGKILRGNGTNFVSADNLVSKSISLLDPTTTESGLVQFYWPRAVTLERIACSTDTGTVSINLNERAEGTPNTSGTDALSASLVCDTNSQTTTTFSDSVHAADVPIALTITATSGAPTVVRVHIRAREN